MRYKGMSKPTLKIVNVKKPVLFVVLNCLIKQIYTLICKHTKRIVKSVTNVNFAVKRSMKKVPLTYIDVYIWVR